ncbi:ComEA family DNA-binding protein [Olsenella sp. An290]|uniref:ComEA family DNA-binding protein n=1 Tax=Olsenella sp. An290 TaxID=1965625 RepID=UPI000B38A484|nr:ComEA family DNA-binding protein [Olsenella sp. An290]OUO35502.1 hypothetical protein B5F84_02000 [Olsenella sp. An290]
MAQERRAGRLSGRLGLRVGVAAAGALAALAVAATALGLLGGPGGVTIERSAGMVEEAAEGPQDAAGEKDVGGEKDGSGEGGVAAAEPEAPLVVHVDGAVAAPGVYELPAGSRANDAVLAAGGVVEGADTSSINLAAPLADGEKVHVPLAGEASPAPSAGAGAAPEQASGPVNLNTAGVEELDALPGVGEATARAIIEDRERNGPFSSPEDLMRVSGIGEKKFEKLEAMVCV